MMVEKRKYAKPDIRDVNLLLADIEKAPDDYNTFSYFFGIFLSTGDLEMIESVCLDHFKSKNKHSVNGSVVLI